MKKSGCCGFSDDEIFGMALHYYQEDNIEVGSPLKCNVVVNHHVELSEEEKKAAREAAIKKLQEEELAKLKKRQQAKRENNTEVQTQLTLFDMKPKTKLQMEIVNGSRKLAPVSEAQKRYAYKHCFVHYFKRDAKGNCFFVWIVGIHGGIRKIRKTVNVLIAV